MSLIYKLFATNYVLLSLFFGLFFLIDCSNSSTTIGVKPVIKVNNSVLTAKDFSKQLADILITYDSITANNPTTIQRIKESILKQFVFQEIIKNWAKENNIEITDSELSSESKKIRSLYPNDMSFRQSLASQGVSFNLWSDQLKESLLQKKVLEKMQISIEPPTENEIQSYIESNGDRFQIGEAVKIQQIVVLKKESSEHLLNLIKKGSDLGKLAKEYSITPESENLGITDWIERGTLDVFDQAFSMPIGGLSSIIKSPYGYHIYKVIDHRKSSRYTNDQAKKMASRYILANREQAKFSDWLDHEIRKTKIFRNNDLIQSITVKTKGKD